ncbi:MAG TPA: Rid family detoxifying hydrolase [Gemmatimonadaceae bacterium]|nr:Rid family detoxifying hydrolase [Gemmatimonadaceae bacterium]
MPATACAAALRAALALTSALTLASCARPVTTELEFYPSPRPQAVFSPAVRFGNLLFVSGQIGTDSTGRVVQGGIQAEGRQALNNMQTTLERYGSSLDRVVKCTVFLADMKDFQEFNQIYATYFRARKPARSAVAVSGLAANAHVEVECIGVTS